MTPRDLHVTPRPIPAQLRPAHDINLPLCFLSSSPIQHGVCPSDRTAITFLFESSRLDFLGNVPFFLLSENGRGFVFQFQHIPLNLGLTFSHGPEFSATTSTS